MLLPSGDGVTPAPSSRPVQPPGQVPGARFLVVRLRAGYDMQAVDEWLAAVESAARG